MGGNKLFLTFRGKPLLEWILPRLIPCFEEIFVAVGPEDREILEPLLADLLQRWPLRIVQDREPGRGPLEGLSSGLRSMSSPWAFLVGCDMPWIQEIMIRALWEIRKPESQVICARIGGYLEPLHAFYAQSALPLVEEALGAKEFKLKSFYSRANLQVLEEEAFAHLPGAKRSFLGMNTLEEKVVFEEFSNL